MNIPASESFIHSCFYAQQGAEKALKAALVLEGLEVPHVHDLNRVEDRDWQGVCGCVRIALEPLASSE